MSNTKRKTSGDEFGPEWKATADKRKWYKATSQFKKTHVRYERAEDKEFDRNLTTADPDEVLPPVHYKNHDWNFW